MAKPIPVGPTAKLKADPTWDRVNPMTRKFFNLVLELKLTAQEKKDLVAFMLVL